MKVVLTAEALGDLERIGDYIAQDNPERARSFVAELLDKARGLADLPEGFPLVPRYADHGMRRRAHGSYLIFYRMIADLKKSKRNEYVFIDDISRLARSLRAHFAIRDASPRQAAS